MSTDASSQVCAGCLKSGDKLAGDVKGKLTQCAGVDCYVTGDNKEHAILYSIDVWVSERGRSSHPQMDSTARVGYDFHNHHRVADSYAEAGFTVYVPRTAEKMDANDPNALSKFGEWVAVNTPARAAQIATKVAEQLTKDYKSVQVVGFCYGARPAVDVLLAGKAKAGVLFHPTFLTVDDVPKLAAKKTPILFNCASNEGIFVPAVRNVFEAGLKETAQFIEYPDTTHGFGARPEGDAQIKASKEAHANAIKFFKAHA